MQDTSHQISEFKRVISDALSNSFDDALLFGDVLASGAGQLAFYCQVLGTILGLIFIAYSFHKIVIKGNGTWTGPLLKLFGVGLLLGLYTLYMPIVAGVMNTVIAGTEITYNNRSKEEMREDISKHKQKWLTDLNEKTDVDESELGSLEEENGSAERGVEQRQTEAEIKNVEANTGSMIGDAILNALFELFGLISFVLASAIKLLLLGIRSIVLPVLYMLGPFALVLTLVPSLENSGIEWFKAFLAVYMWKAVINIFDYVIHYQADILSDVDGSHWITMVLSLAWGLAYIAVPEISKMLFSSQFGSSIERALAQLLPYIGALATSFASKLKGGGGTGQEDVASDASK